MRDPKSFNNEFFVLIGETHSGKSTLGFMIADLLKEGPNRVTRIPSLTTKTRRLDEKGDVYIYVTREKFLELQSQGRLLKPVEYDGHFYGDLWESFESALESGHALKDVNEYGYQNLKSFGYRVRPIKIIPQNVKLTREVSQDRIEADKERAKIHVPYELIVYNSFDPGGLEEAARQIISYISEFPIREGS